MTDLFEAGTETTTSLDLRRMQREVRRRDRRARTLIATSIAMVIFAVAASASWEVIQSFKSTAVEIPDYEGAGQGQVRVIVNAGDGGDDIAATLYAAGVVASTDAFILETYANPEAARSISPGYYFLQREMKAEYALLALLDSENRDEVRLTIVEGKPASYVYERIAALTGIPLEVVQAAAEDTAALDLPEEANGNIEGWLFPATYAFNPDVDATDVLAEMVGTTIKVLDSYGVEPKDRNRILTVASIVERESRLEVDRPLVASVIYNRLGRDMPLEMDSTITYLTGEYGTVWTTAEARAIDSPYNTYKYVGLPPGPIAGAGEATIKAAISPADTPYIFFVPINLITGETRYATTYADHLKNVEILNKWYAENGG